MVRVGLKSLIFLPGIPDVWVHGGMQASKSAGGGAKHISSLDTAFLFSYEATVKLAPFFQVCWASKKR